MVELEEIQGCRERMVFIFKAIIKFHEDHKRLPRFLSDLVPDYCSAETLTCPAKNRVGNSDWAREKLRDEALHDPECPSSTYSYEFIDKYWQDTSIKFYEYKNAQRDYLDLHSGNGRRVPIVRCFMHGPNAVVNISLDGKVTIGGQDWEDDFANPSALYPANLMPEVTVKIDGVIPPRGKDVGPNLLDLTSEYNGAIRKSWYLFPPQPDEAFASLLSTPCLQGPTVFDVRGVIQLRGQQLARPFPLKKHGIKVGQRARRIHFLMGAYGEAPLGQKIALLRLNFADRLPLLWEVRYGLEFLSWRLDPADAPFPELKEKVAWTKRIEHGGKVEFVRLYNVTTSGELPDAEILSIDFEVEVIDGKPPRAAPALFGITLEPRDDKP
jgi:hypothetical protein